MPLVVRISRTDRRDSPSSAETALIKIRLVDDIALAPYGYIAVENTLRCTPVNSLEPVNDSSCARKRDGTDEDSNRHSDQEP